jgi:hypothetical protein
MRENNTQTPFRSSDVYAISTSLNITLESSLQGLSANMLFISGAVPES